MKKYIYIVYFLILLIVVYGIGKFMEHLSVNKKENLPAIPSVYSNISNADREGLTLTDSAGEVYTFNYVKPEYRIEQFRNSAKGNDQGIEFDFGNDFEGSLHYGFIDRSESRTTFPVFFKKISEISNGKTSINISQDLSKKYDMVGWEESGQFEIGYRVINSAGKMLYDGKLFVKGKGPFKIAPSVIEGPFINKVTSTQAVVSFTTNRKVKARIAVDGRILNSPRRQLKHEITIDKLRPDSIYQYHLLVDDYKFSSRFSTAPRPGRRDRVIFGFTSDSRAGKGGGERNMHGVNTYMMKKIAAYADMQDVDFWQFTGDMIDGYLQNISQTKLQYANWKRAIEPFAHNTPIYVGMGNHEAVTANFVKNSEEYGIAVDRFPFETASSEAIFAEQFVNFENGPESEDGADYDPVMEKHAKPDFPSYRENVYSYTWDNVAMIVLNSDYWYAPTPQYIPVSSGNPHGYIMDNQLLWLKQKLKSMDSDSAIDHIFITIHTPPFPNGGHAKDDMWYDGNNKIRPYVNGKPHEKGIIERRDEFLDLVINKSSKTRALLCGDEHNYSRLLINDSMPCYPETYDKPRLKITRDFWQLTNGSAGAPYYSQQKLPWSGNVKIFSTQNAFILFRIEGRKIDAEVVNPETFQVIETFKLK
ncbi:MAG: metallophosphoesterase [Bacteroidales bacterium]|nr:metallophosphoesterase [Bacteroidales bacterium]